jgi:hypothetical protein
MDCVVPGSLACSSDRSRSTPSSTARSWPAARPCSRSTGSAPPVLPASSPRRRRRKVRRPEPVRLLDRHRTPGRILSRTDPPPALPRRQPPAQPRPAHRGHRPAAQRHRGPRLLPTQTRGRQDPARSAAMPKAATLRRHLPPPGRRCQGAGSQWPGHGPGRASRGDSTIQRGRPAPAHRHFGSATPGPAEPTLRPTPHPRNPDSDRTLEPIP